MNTEHSSVNEAVSRPRTRKRTKAGSESPPNGEQMKRKTTRKRVGKLTELLNMPLDILFEIFGHLLPYDLLKLTRTTKAFRRLLLSRSSLSVWKTALERIPGLPPCPPDMSEPAFANLAFSPHCHFCLTNSRKVEWCLRIRICSKCVEVHLRDLHHLMVSYHPKTSETEHPFSLFIPSELGKRGKVLYLPSALDEFTKKYLAIPEDNRDSFLAEQQHTIRERTKHAQLCASWERGQLKDRESELRQLRKDRKDAIVQKLEELGWGEDVRGIVFPDSLARHKLVDRPQRLTEKIWANIKDDILEFMQELREKRLKREYKALVIKRKEPAIEFMKAFKKSKLHEAQIMPEGPDFCNFDIIKEILHQPVEVEVNSANFEAILPILPLAITQWREQLQEFLLELLKSRLAKVRLPYYYDSDIDEYGSIIVEPPTERSLNDSNLELATTVFRCENCSSRFDPDDFYFFSDLDSLDNFPQHNVLLFYPQVCGHACLTRRRYGWFDSLQQVNDYSIDINDDDTFSERVPWNDRWLVVDHEASRATKEIVVLLGLDPLTATTNDLDQLQQHLICHTCVKSPSIDRPEDLETDESTPVVPLLTWRAAVKHHTDYHRGSTSFRLVPELCEEVEVAESAHKDKWRIWSCLRCKDTPQEVESMSLSKVKDHCLGHGVNSPVLNEDYCKDFDAPDIEAKQAPLWVKWHDNTVSIACKAQEIQAEAIAP